ncbi:MAG: formyl transferase [Sphingobacteriales bacterium]|nr:formyl transferase [Sphingobacteriales bacterium]
MNKKIVMLCSDCFSTVTLYNAVSRQYSIDRVITEEPMRGMALAKRRVKKLGWFRVAGQVLFSVCIVPLIRAGSRKRMAQIHADYRFDETPVPPEKITHVTTVNSEECLTLLKELNPDVVMVNGTRIISKKVLESTKAVFINMHTGITPKYRGVHGGYWALVNNDPANCGVTVHLVDKGIDTGGILYQSLIPVTKEDNYFTYPYLQFGEGIPLVQKAVEDALQQRIRVVESRTKESALWYHPTIWQYLVKRLTKGIK